MINKYRISSNKRTPALNHFQSFTMRHYFGGQRLKEEGAYFKGRGIIPMKC